jgi:hypothetical protein
MVALAVPVGLVCLLIPLTLAMKAGTLNPLQEAKLHFWPRLALAASEASMCCLTILSGTALDNAS